MSNLPQNHSLTTGELTSNDLSCQQEGFVTISVDKLETSIRSLPESVIPASVEEITRDESSSPKEPETAFIDKVVAAFKDKAKIECAEEKEEISIKHSNALIWMKNETHQPFILSIGPYHRGLTNVENMENFKWKIQEELYLGESIPRDIIRCVKSLEPKARKCYETSFTDLSCEEFVQILLLDSIFILFLIGADVSNFGKILEGSLLADMLLPDNQIPFFLIRELWEKVHAELCETVLAPFTAERDLIINLERTKFLKKGSPDAMGEVQSARHLLDLYYQCNVPSESEVRRLWTTRRRTQRGDNRSATSAFPSAVELHEFGIKFKAKENPSSMFDISFVNGVLHIPTLVIDRANTSIITSLLSWEDISNDDRVVTSYVRFMDSLINTKLDIGVLQKFNVVVNKMQSDDDAAAFFNSLGDSVAQSFFLSRRSNVYAPLMEEMRRYSSPCWRRDWTSLKHTYFSNPWSGISVIAGSGLLVLTIMQTYYAAYAYYHPNN